MHVSVYVDCVWRRKVLTGTFMWLESCAVQHIHLYYGRGYATPVFIFICIMRETNQREIITDKQICRKVWRWVSNSYVASISEDNRFTSTPKSISMPKHEGMSGRCGGSLRMSINSKMAERIRLYYIQKLVSDGIYFLHVYPVSIFL